MGKKEDVYIPEDCMDHCKYMVRRGLGREMEGPPDFGVTAK